MLSPGQWHKKVPKAPCVNLLFRRYLMRKCREPRFRASVMEACKQDCLFWISTFVWQFNPQKVGREVGPFIPWDFQEDGTFVLLDHLEQRRDLLMEKSREMGGSWWVLIVFDWLCLFHSWKKFTAISHSEQAVDKSNDLSTLFGKVTFIHDHLPGWMMHARKRKLFFTFARTNSSFSGLATTARSGVGGRETGLLLDEFAKQEAAQDIWGQTADTGPRIVVSTHYGVGTVFFDLCQRPGLDKLVMHWSQHPDKNKGLYRYDAATNKVEILDKSYVFPQDYRFVMDGSPTGGPYPGVRGPWYDLECARRASARDVAMHLDIDAKGSAFQFFDRLMIQRLITTHACAPWWEGDVVYSEAGEPVKLVPRPGGPLRLWCHLNHEGKPALDQYGAGADISAGSGATPSCFSLVRVSTGEKVAEYANAHIFPDKFAVLCVALCRLFKSQDNDGALFAWEQQGPGGVFGTKVLELGYYNIYYKTDETEENPEQTTKPGWYPAPANKRLLLEELRIDLGTNDFLNRSKEALEETLSFKYDRRGMVVHGNQTGILDPSGASVNHADRVIADGLANKMRRKLGTPSVKKREIGPPVLSLQWRRDLADKDRDRESA